VLAVVVAVALAGCGSTALKQDDGGRGGAGGAQTGSGGSGGAAMDSGATGGGGDGGTGGGAGGAGVDAGIDAGLDAGADVPTCGATCVITFASSSEWIAYDDDPASNAAANQLGAAQPVCLNAGAPPNCPAGAVLYGFANATWAANLATIPAALWIWGPGTTMSGAADLKRFAFVHQFVLGATPNGTLNVAADDFAEVRVNGTVASSIGSVTDVGAASAANNSVKTIDISSLLRPGGNTITVIGQNGPPSFAGGCGGAACTYAQNPAGVVFGGTLSYH
jgi:hypothetical protein